MKRIMYCNYKVPAIEDLSYMKGIFIARDSPPNSYLGIFLSREKRACTFFVRKERSVELIVRCL